jgi:hypothetical protein
MNPKRRLLVYGTISVAIGVSLLISYFLILPFLISGSSVNQQQINESWVSYPTMKDLKNASDVIIEGKVVGIASSNNSGAIPTTDFSVYVNGTVKGNVSVGSTILVRQVGAILSGNRTISDQDDPMMSIGSNLILFLEYPRQTLNGPIQTGSPFFITGGPQGRFVVKSGLVYSLDTINQADSWIHVKANGIPIDQFVSQIQAA